MNAIPALMKGTFSPYCSVMRVFNMKSSQSSTNRIAQREHDGGSTSQREYGRRSRLRVNRDEGSRGYAAMRFRFAPKADHRASKGDPSLCAMSGPESKKIFAVEP